MESELELKKTISEISNFYADLYIFKEIDAMTEHKLRCDSYVDRKEKLGLEALDKYISVSDLDEND